MKILFQNDAKTATITATNAAGNYPTSNLVHQFMKKVYKAVSNTSTITVTFSAELDVNCIYMGYHNLTSLVITLYDDTDSVLFTETITITDEPYKSIIARHYSTLYSAKKVTLACTCASSTVVVVGEIGIGEELAFPDPDSEPTHGFTDNSTISTSAGGNVLQNKYDPLRNEVYPFTKISRTDRNAIVDAYKLVGIGGKIWAAMYENRPEIAAPMYCTITDAPSFIRVAGDLYSGQIKLQEAN